MEFRVLGPLEVAVGEHPVNLAGARTRAVLALLLVHANQVVPSDRLIEIEAEAVLPDSGAEAVLPDSGAEAVLPDS